ncbi:MAG: hypothetical protein PSV17_00585 [Methylotenera sp.]|uniref:hypothetical protein n=1 Tax=Methylotenera sp. TaxID=2051956 RepID=UPI002489AE89|nr:hypothetical protein [Methylotenera sp.]MDI1307913.1 hypothetical protein [Methylotenera sp.]
MNNFLKDAANAQKMPVSKRRVYYIGGFDPRGASFYHRLYKDEALKQGTKTGNHIEVGPRHKVSSHQHSWVIKSDYHQHTVNTDYRFLGWDDIVRQHWETNGLRLVALTIKGYARFIDCGALGRIRKLYRGPFYSGIYPVAFLFITALLSIIFGGISVILVASVGAPPVVTAMVSLLAMLACFWMGLKLADRLGVLWLLRTYLFVYFWGESTPDKLNARIKAFADIIVQDQNNSPCDEVIVIGHSVGSIVAVSVVARALEQSAEKLNLSLVTLGQCIPLLSLIPSAEAFRHDLKTLAEHPDVAWLDMVARADALCFSQVDPIKASGIDSSMARWPKQQIVRPFKMFSPEQYKRLKRNKLRLHFQYLMSSEYQTDYDYFLLTAGSSRLCFSE